jgi:hypothetical protein
LEGVFLANEVFEELPDCRVSSLRADFLAEPRAVAILSRFASNLSIIPARF